MRVAWTEPALEQLDRIQDYIAEDSPLAAYRVVNEIYERANAALSGNPLIGRPGRVTQTRELVMANLPYIVVYRVGADVEIVAVRHTARSWPESFGD
jgi:addiction module RelE/StbE family toxin